MPGNNKYPIRAYNRSIPTRKENYAYLVKLKTAGIVSVVRVTLIFAVIAKALAKAILIAFAKGDYNRQDLRRIAYGQPSAIAVAVKWAKLNFELLLSDGNFTLNN